MKRKVLFCAIFVAALLTFATGAHYLDKLVSAVTVRAGTLVVDTDYGTSVNLIAAGQTDIADNATSITVSVPGADAGDIVALTFNESSAGSWLVGWAYTDNIIINTPDPNTTLTVNWVVIGK